jgi:hypothetical protein
MAIGIILFLLTIEYVMLFMRISLVSIRVSNSKIPKSLYRTL